jgi:N-acetylmuramoyl-L-alanine amidase
MQNAEIALARLTDPAPVAGNYPGPWQSEDVQADAPLPKVSAHYVVDEAGQIYSLVPEEHRAWHAGISSWEGDGEVNARAIGIEIVNGGHDFQLPDFPDAQINGVIALLQDILGRWPELNPKRVVAHSDIAPARKADPGEKFPWKRLAEAGVSIWPEHVATQLSSDDPVSEVQQDLAFIGYPVTQTGYMDEATKEALIAFQRRFRPSDISGAMDDETRYLLIAVSRMVK